MENLALKITRSVCYVERRLHPMVDEELTLHGVTRRICGPLACSSVDMRIIATLLLMATLAGTCSAADAIKPPPPVSNTIDPATGLPTSENDPLMEMRFDINFNGGPPKIFIETVERASKIPLNAIIPEEHNDFILPPVKLRNVTLPQLFDALIKSSA